MAAVQESFASALSWTLGHPWGTVHPAPVVVDSDGNTRLVACAYGDGFATVTFSEPVAGTFTLIGDADGSTIPPPVVVGVGGQTFGPWSNAVLVEIRQAGSVDKYGKTSTPGDPLWAGSATGYIARSRASSVDGGLATERLSDVFWIRDLTGVPVIEEPGARWYGSTVTIDDLRSGVPVRRMFNVRSFEHRATGLDVDNVKVGLFNEQVA